MSQTRIYLPLNAVGLKHLSAARAVSGSPVRAFAVTDRVERSLPAGDQEEWEYAALTEAVEAATLILPTLEEKRVIAAADVDSTWVRGNGAGDSLAAVEVSHPVPLARIVSFHVDETAGDDGMSDLLWFDATELDEVLRVLQPGT
ncbi:MAG TPA: hypothetical protein VGN19_12665 [Pedococcus sp.]|nr:hypothetical protein [Pedococcus sp.]